MNDSDGEKSYEDYGFSSLILKLLFRQFKKQIDSKTKIFRRFRWIIVYSTDVYGVKYSTNF